MDLVDSVKAALFDLLAALAVRDYRFVTPTPATHAIVLARDPHRQARSLTDVLGWSLPFHQNRIDPAIFALLGAAHALIPQPGGCWRATIRVSTIGDHRFIHSAFPTNAPDAVFLGPDSYRFAAAITTELASRGLRAEATVCDIGTGSGVGAIVVGAAWPDAVVTMTDINPRALACAQINAAAAGVAVHAMLASDLAGVPDMQDLILANPPFIIDALGRAYRDGGGAHGSAVALTMTAMALPRLAPAGRFLLYTGSAIVGGEDRLQRRLQALADAAGCSLRYRETDPDVFGEELVHPAYHDVDRIAVVVAVFTAGAGSIPGTGLACLARPDEMSGT